MERLGEFSLRPFCPADKSMTPNDTKPNCTGPRTKSRHFLARARPTLIGLGWRQDQGMVVSSYINTADAKNKSSLLHPTALCTCIGCNRARPLGAL